MRRYIPILLIVIALSARLIPGPRIIDDSYITYRYSRNILAGNGFVFNPGERVLGTTTPLYTLILVGIGSVTGGTQAPFPIISWLLNAILDSVSCVSTLANWQDYWSQTAWGLFYPSFGRLLHLASLFP